MPEQTILIFQFYYFTKIFLCIITDLTFQFYYLIYMYVKNMFMHYNCYRVFDIPILLCKLHVCKIFLCIIADSTI